MSSEDPAAQNESAPQKPKAFWFLRVTCAVMLVGHGLLCLQGVMPLRALLWDEELFAGAVNNLFGMEWEEWATSIHVDDGIATAIRIQGFIFLGFALIALVPIRAFVFRLLYLLASLNLTFLAWLKFHDTGMAITQFYEHASQFLFPIVLFLAAAGRRWVWLASIAVIATFVGHGLYALNATSDVMLLNHPRPGQYTEMTMACLGIETEATANKLLTVAGILDLVVPVLMFLPGLIRRISLSYLVLWGFLTALARPWAHYDANAVSESLLRWIPEFLYRAPHFMLPLCILLAVRSKKGES